MAAPAQAGALFDFNLTLPIQMAQFLLFMVFLDKTWFTPIGNLLEQRDADIRQRLANVKDNADEIERLQKEAERKLQEARDEVNNMIAEAKAEAEKEAAEEERKERERLDKELQQALDDLDKAKQQAEKELDSQIETLANDIVEQVLPKSSEPQGAAA